MPHRRSGLVILSTLAFLFLAVVGAAPALAQYGPQPPPPPPPPPPGGGGGYYQPGSPYYPAPEPPGVQRRGFTIGGSLGGGSYTVTYDRASLDDRFEGPAIEGHIGGMVTRQLGILFEGWSVGAAVNDNQTLVHTVGTVALRYFLGERFWLQGGLGFAYFSLNDDRGTIAESDESGGAIVLAAGVEIFQTNHLTLDLSLRLGAAGYSDASVGMSSLQIGLNWY